MMRARMRLAGALLAAALLLAGAAPAAHAHGSGDLTSQSELAEVRAATARFADVDAAIAAGYGELVDAAGIACIDSPAGGMGIHYVDVDLVLDPALDPAMPEVLVYEPDRHGRLHLVAVEYVAFESMLGGVVPELFGQTLHRMPGPNEPAAQNRYGLPAFYELHVWLWKHNPDGMFEDWNPRVDCP
ncbi:hypothetical protein [Microbacterium sp. Root53]|uniref:hypothetical protein n=1 Tax=Microbacterium sp. Root53 TaxID=1736553 RepID=UPI00190FEDEE|nr:hypothetical protein [Microbacterium sp. Root53]